MNKPLILSLAALSFSLSCSTVFARGADDGAVVDLTGRNQDVVLKRQGADNVGIDLRGRTNDVILKRGADDGAIVDLTGRNQDAILKRQGADDPVNHIRRGRGADDLVNMRSARGRR